MLKHIMKIFPGQFIKNNHYKTPKKSSISKKQEKFTFSVNTDLKNE